MLQRIEPEVKINLVQQYMIAVLLEEDATDNSFERGLPGLVGLRRRRQPENDILFFKMLQNDEFKSLYRLGKAPGTDSQSLPKQVIIGRMGLIYYIGPMMDNENF